MVGLVEQMSTFPINSRIKVNSDYGTVKFFGEIKGYSGLWVGVEWDDSRRGKHSGCVNEIQYFETTCPNAGSMIRPGKIAPFDSLAGAIEKRYVLNIGNPLDENLMREAKEYVKASIFEFVGAEKIMKKQSHVEQLEDISVAYSNTQTAGNLMPFFNLVSVNLTATLIWNWRIVADIVSQLPRLSYLNLSQNRLVLPSDLDISDLEPSFRHLKDINLSDCGLNSFRDILHTARLFPWIESLSLQNNNITTLAIPNCDLVFKNLQNLDLHKNNLSSFEEILKLGHIQSLKVLLLMQNGLRRIHLPDCEPTDYLDIFRNLLEINLRDNPIENESETFNELDKLQQLSVLNQSPDPKSGFENMFSRAVGLISNLKTLNKIEVNPGNRRDAEYDTWKQYGWEYLQTSGSPTDRNKFMRKIRAYGRIVEKYGSPEESLVRPMAKQSSVIIVNLLDPEANRLVSKKLPKKMLIQALQGLVLKLFKSDAGKLPILSYVDAERQDVCMVLDNMSKSLDYYSIQDGDTVIIQW
ncbi:tubulin-specific chaperone E [Phlebotomus argentipes]|uniref:tubulin-specific chaperone E n=1 Tax=Phlebotomus argentipes TaxID=94469 RepID=UPI0028932E98|nr:tubulin-specific chaperone E [Phlebotomus argentipes]